MTRGAAFTSEKRASAAAYAAAVLLLTGLLLAAWQFFTIGKSVLRQAAYADSLGAAQGALLQLINEETGVRGYVATGDQRFLQIFYDSRRPLTIATLSLGRTMRDDPSAQATFARYFQDRRRVEGFFRSEIGLVQRGRQGVALRRLSRGRLFFDQLRRDDAALQALLTGRLNAQRRSTLLLSRSGESISLIVCGAVVVLLVAFIFIAERSRAYRASSLRDQLTGAGNRERALTKLQTLVKQRDAKPFGIVFVDLDGFKKINDRYGHAAGDAILKAVASRMRGELREDDVVCRMGGDEFLAIVIDPGEAEGLNAIARRLRNAVKRSYTFEGDEYVIGCSMGTCRFPQDERTVDGLLERADVAMYRAKVAGGGVQSASPRAESA